MRGRAETEAARRTLGIVLLLVPFLSAGCIVAKTEVIQGSVTPPGGPIPDIPMWVSVQVRSSWYNYNTIDQLHEKELSEALLQDVHPPVPTRDSSAVRVSFVVRDAWRGVDDPLAIASVLLSVCTATLLPAVGPTSVMDCRVDLWVEDQQVASDHFVTKSIPLASFLPTPVLFLLSGKYQLAMPPYDPKPANRALVLAKMQEMLCRASVRVALEEAYRDKQRMLASRAKFEPTLKTLPAPAADRAPGAPPLGFGLALLVGINEYESMGKLEHSREDAQALRDALLRYGGFSKGRTVLVTDAAPDCWSRCDH